MELFVREHSESSGNIWDPWPGSSKGAAARGMEMQWVGVTVQKENIAKVSRR